MNDCVFCRLPIQPGAGYCTECGERQDQDTPVIAGFQANPAGCPKCGAPPQPPDRFCSHCGWYLVDRSARPDGALESAPQLDKRYFLRPDLPRDPGHVIEYWDYFLLEMRHTWPEAVIERCQAALGRSFRALDPSRLPALAAAAVNDLYFLACSTRVLDDTTRRYYEEVVRSFWKLMAERDVRVVQVIDNTLTRERLWVMTQLFLQSGFTVLCPHIPKVLTIEKNTLIDMVEDYLENRVNLVYIEADAELNYLSEVTSACRRHSGYLRFFRNEGPLPGSQPHRF